MRRAAVRVLLVALTLGVSSAVAAPPPANPTCLPRSDDPAELSATIRSILQGLLPTPLYEDHKHWGHQKEVTRGLKWTGEGPDFHVEKQKKLKNDGLWWRVKVTAPDLDKSLVFELHDIQTPEAGKMTFTVFVAFNTSIEYERQRWDAGHRLFSTSIRGRSRVSLTLQCESVTRLEDSGKFLPDTVFRLHVTKSDVHFDDVVFEHVAGVGGDAAKLIGETALANLHLWRPSLEQRLIDRANAAIVKAGDTREVRLGIGKLFQRKKK
jgi:hypothetical protein